MKRYITSTLRHLWKFRLFTTLNVVGLAVSISSCWIIFRIVNHEYSYDRSLPNRKKIYRVISGFNFDDKKSYNGGVSAPIYQAVRTEVGGLDYTIPVLGKWFNSVAIPDASGITHSFDDPGGIAATDSSYFKMVPYRWLAGNQNNSLAGPQSVVLTESRAKKYFPHLLPREILNKTITYFGWRDTLTKTVTGIVADLEGPSDFTSQEFFTLPTKAYELSAWTNTNGSDRLYLQFKNGTDRQKVINQIDHLVMVKFQEFEKTSNNNFKFTRWYELVPLGDFHFSTFVEEYQIRKASKPVLYGLIGIGIFLLVLACINYINMSVAQIPQRAVEIGVRKTLGSSRRQLIGQFLIETVLTTVFAAILAFPLSFAGFWLLGDIIPAEIRPMNGILQMLSFVFMLIIVATVLAGLYPGWLITRVKTINVFRRAAINGNGRRGLSLQKALIIFQFMIALVFITSAMIVGKQLNYTLKSDMGFNKDAVVLVDIPWKYFSDKLYKDRQFALFNELKKDPGIEKISLGNTPMTDGYSSSVYEYAREGKEPVSRTVYKKEVDTNYIGLYQMKLIAGRNLSQSDTAKEFVVNETAVKAFGFTSPQDALGKMIGQKNEKYPIIGVISDFHLQNFYKAIDPVALFSEKESMSTFNIKLQSHDPGQWQASLKKIEKYWYQFYPPETFSYKFYDETLEAMYKEERNFSKLVNLATIITILISCLGLFGLAVLTAFQRTKEIGIRKVLGASVGGIMQLLSKEYIGLVIIAFVISTPIAWWAMNKWLQDFVYRIDIKWWIFLIAGLIAIVLALITVSYQAFKAARANPVKSLRSE